MSKAMNQLDKVHYLVELLVIEAIANCLDIGLSKVGL